MVSLVWLPVVCEKLFFTTCFEENIIISFIIPLINNRRQLQKQVIKLILN